ncbi:unnamed protein product [Vitrella brassicaformis CCMP3155]|uniref:HNH nuclease domain-containing protein n=1 Tax=Vitrella brassicaformis (strain CCMP3155) TaxID=1169540 RepID=A0A0G4GWA2_VITBC|nr:unnamed protein product [Vitrella brassicaformis CCMP3155]|eukprot:CEM35287.1 unnamed protein product [Vitrella brassicaformis CCMP3155]
MRQLSLFLPIRQARAFTSRRAEHFLPVPPFDGICKRGAQVSTHGRVKHHNGPLTSGWTNGSGYLCTKINAKSYLVHRLVAETFLAQQKEDLQRRTESAHALQVDHIDGNKKNNAVDNLQWLDTKQHREKTAREIARPKPLFASSRPVVARCRHTGRITSFQQAAIAARHFQVHSLTMFKTLIGRYRPSFLRDYTLTYAAHRNRDGERFRTISFVKEAYHSLPPSQRPSRLPKVSNQGRVRHVNGHVTEGTYLSTGYRRVTLRGRNFLVHRLVAEVWLADEKAKWLEKGCTEDELEVDHIDGRRDNNCSQNLRWLPKKQHQSMTARRTWERRKGGRSTGQGM